MIIAESTDISLNDILKEYFVPKLSDNEQKSVEGYITHKEASVVVNSMSNNKSPGGDGFTVEFFKMFWNEIGSFVVRSLNSGYKVGELSSTQTQGIITCIPREVNSPLVTGDLSHCSMLYTTLGQVV